MIRNSFKLLCLMICLTMVVTICGCSKTGLNYNPSDYITKVGNYAGLVIVRGETKVTDQEVLEAIYKDLADYVTQDEITEGTVAEGDRIVMDFTGSIDGQVYDNTKAQDYEYVLGSGRLLTGIDSQLYGRNIGEKFTIEVELPEDYYDGALAGRKMSLEVNIKCKKADRYPELTDQFVANLEVDEFDTVDEMKAYYLAQLVSAREESADEAQVDLLWSTIVDSFELSGLPRDAVNSYVEAMVEQVEANAENYGVTYLNMLSYMGYESDSEYRAACIETAEQTVKEDIVYYYIIDAEGISHTRKEARVFAEENYEQFGYTSKDQLIDQYGIDYIIEYLNKSALWDFLFENNQLETSS